jgi:plasmid maintenance system antidote protein VapI
MATKKMYGIESLIKLFGPPTMAMFLSSWRECDEISLTAFAKMLGISRANLCDIEKKRKLVSPERAARFAKKLGVAEEFLVQLALEDLLRQAKLNFRVEVRRVS